MSHKPVSAKLIRRQGEELQDLALDEARSAELATEVTGLNHAVREDAAALEFDDEPLAYAARMRALARVSHRVAAEAK